MLTRPQQLLLLELLLKKKLKKKEQKIYKSQKFYESVSELKKFGLIECKKDRNNGEKIYFLTFHGRVRANLISNDDNVPEKYRKLYRQLTIIP